MRRKLSVGVLLLTIMATAWMFTGCGDKGQSEAEKEQVGGGESSDKSVDADTNQATDKDASVDEGANKSADAPVASPNASAELSVNVESIGDNSVVGNKIFIETVPDGDGEIMIVGAGGDNQELVTVYFEENASYVYETIRNGGADVETREGSFSDIGLDMILDLTGYYKGEDFYADKVVISNVILD